ncbi:hypothetical protein H4R18_004956 [Coemansia javaensis]|uniref:Uncharacterized protein n=1 Tax=Coemansia javaensis TaxID=2761396 RepID=A0A9W8H440_9FUNG|nr:hypothetical protein H4R18_004956 [Coemansia javaensis]
MGLDDSSQRNLDRVGGIIAAVLFAACLAAHVWQWVRHRCHPLAASTAFLVLRTVGWLLAFIGAVQGDALLNKRGYIANAVAFWLLPLTGLLLLARWDATRRGARWSARSWGGTGAAAILCLGFGALDAAGQITWLNNPADGPSVAMKIASVGLLVVVGIYALVGLFFNFREALFYQRPSVRWAFFLTATLLVLRCVFWMLVGTGIIQFDEVKRLIFLFCLGTTFEIGAAAVWGFMSVARHLHPKGEAPAAEMESLRPEPAAAGKPASANKPLPADTAIPAHEYMASQRSDKSEVTRPDSEAEAETSDDYSASAYNTIAMPQPAAAAGTIGHAYAGAPGRQPSYRSSYSSPYQPPPAHGAVVGPPPGGSPAMHSPMQQHVMVPVQSQPMQIHSQPQIMVQSQPHIMVQSQPQLVQVQLQPRPVTSQPVGVPAYTTGVSSAPPPAGDPGISFAPAAQEPYAGASAPPTTFVKTPYPQGPAAAESQSYVDQPRAVHAPHRVDGDAASHSDPDHGPGAPAADPPAAPAAGPRE